MSAMLLIRIRKSSFSRKNNQLFVGSFSENVVGGQETRLTVVDDVADQGFVAFLELGSYQGAD